MPPPPPPALLASEAGSESEAEDAAGVPIAPGLARVTSARGEPEVSHRRATTYLTISEQGTEEQGDVVGDHAAIERVHFRSQARRGGQPTPIDTSERTASGSTSHAGEPWNEVK